MRKSAAPALLLPFLCFAAWAGQAYVEIERRLTPEQLREVGLTPAQLQALNRMLREAQEQQPPAQAASAPAAHGDHAPAPAQRSYIGLEDQPIKSRVRGEVAGWEPGTEFALENGQRWKVLKGSLKLRKPLQAPQIEIVPGFAGRWFLQVDGDLPKARVYRID